MAPNWPRAVCRRARNWKYSRPSAREVPPEVFTTAYTNPVGGSPEAVRENLREALRLLKEAGYEVRERKLIDSKTGAQFTLELLNADPSFERVMLFFKPSLERLGIDRQRAHDRSDAI